MRCRMCGKFWKTFSERRYNQAMPQKPDFTPDEILIAEFEYAANNAFQANEDRSKVASFFIVSVGSLAAAIFGMQEVELNRAIHFLLSGLFFTLTFLGLLTVMQLARLRDAWRESAKAMNAIKSYYIDRFKDKQFEQAFLWRNETIPAKYKIFSVSYFTVIEVALLSGLTFGACVYFALMGLAGDGEPVHYSWWLAAGAGIFAGWLELTVYKRMLKHEKEKR